MSRNRSVAATVFSSIHILSAQASLILFLPGYALTLALPVIAGRLQGARVRSLLPDRESEVNHYRAGDTPVSWMRIVRFCLIVQLLIGVSLLAPLCLRATGDLTYLLPTHVRKPSVLLSTNNHWGLLDRFISRFSGVDFWRYWIGASSLVTAVPAQSMRRLASIEVWRRERPPRSTRALLRTLNVVTVLDEPLAKIGMDSFLASGVLFAVLVILGETWVLGLIPH